MKPAQIFLVLIVLVLSLGIVVWIVNWNSTPKLSGQTSKSDKVEPIYTESGEIDYYLENPFDLKEEGETPVAVIDDSLFNFGKMILGTTQDHDFTIRNEGNVPLKLAKGRSMCKCTVSGMAAEEIPPGEEAKVNLNWTPKSTGPFSQGAVIWTNDPNNNKITISVEGEMFNEIVQEPEGNWVLGSVQKDNPQEIVGALYSSVVEHFEITKIETSSEFVQVSFEPMKDEDKEAAKAICGYIIRGTVASDGKAGKLKETVTIHTNLENQPEFTYNITATKPGPLQVIGPGWYATGQLLDLGTVSAETGKQQKLTLTVEPGEQPLEIKVISATPSFLKATLEAAEGNENKKRERYTLTVEVPPNSATGIWPQSKPGSIVLETNHPLIGTFELEVALKVQ